MKKHGDIQAGRRRRRGNGAGTLRKVGNTYFAIFTVVGTDGKKKRVTRTTGKQSLEEAREVLNELAAEYGTKDAVRIDAERRARFTEKLVRAQAIVAADAERLAQEREAILDARPALALKDAWRAYELSGRRKAHASSDAILATYHSYWMKFLKWMEENNPDIVELREVTLIMARGFCKSQEAKVQGLTINRMIYLFQKIWRTLERDDRDKAKDETRPEMRMARLGDNPWQEVERYEGQYNTRRELTVEELGRVVGRLSGEMRLLFAVGIYTGLRKIDCVLLEWSMVDLARGRLMVEPRKTRRHTRGRKIAIPIAPVLFELLREARAHEGSTPGKYVMPELAALYINHQAILNKQISSVFEAAGITTKVKGEGDIRAHTEVGFHSLRHTFVSLSANAGTPLAVVQSIVGHSTSKMTQHYYHENEEAMRGAIARLPDLGQAHTVQEPRAPHMGATLRIARFQALWEEMSDAERQEAREFINKKEAT